MNDVTPTGERIAFRSTKGEGTFAKRRWTELAVYHDPDAPNGHTFTAEAKGKSDHEGELDRITRLSSESITRALAFFEDDKGQLSPPARSIVEQVMTWKAHYAPGVANRQDAVAPAAAPQNDEDALALLYGNARGERGFVSRVAADFGLGESSVRMALKAGTGIRVPLVAVAHLIDAAKLASNRG